jgi:hypothetical protein
MRGAQVEGDALVKFTKFTGFRLFPGIRCLLKFTPGSHLIDPGKLAVLVRVTMGKSLSRGRV